MTLDILKQALAHLDEKVDKLEKSLDTYESKSASRQRDLFGASAAPGPAANVNEQHVDREDIAQRLDQAIEKVEKILEEG